MYYIISILQNHIDGKTKLYIHIGLHKISTTSFQEILENNHNSEFMLINKIRKLVEVKKNHINILSSEGWIIADFNKFF